MDLGRLSFSGYGIVDGNDDDDCALVVRDRCVDVGVRCVCDVLISVCWLSPCFIG